MTPLEGFLQFCQAETAVGGPDPQMIMLRLLCKGRTLVERSLLAGLYVIPYDVSTAEYLWQKLLVDPEQDVSGFVSDEWAAILTRGERRCVRTREKFSSCLCDYMAWSAGIQKYFQYTGRELYDRLWDDCNSLRYMGRYAVIKLLRALRECVRLKIQEYDIRPENAHSPRAALALLYPDKAGVLESGSNDAGTISIVNMLADRTLCCLDDVGVSIGYYELQALLCEYKETLSGRRYYPGRSHDEVMENYYRMSPVRGNYRTDIFRIRQKIFPSECLGEVGGWRTVRKNLQPVLKQYGYVWSDLRFDYMMTADLSSPVGR